MKLVSLNQLKDRNKIIILISCIGLAIILVIIASILLLNKGLGKVNKANMELLGRFNTLEELQAAYPEGVSENGYFEVGEDIIVYNPKGDNHWLTQEELIKSDEQKAYELAVAQGYNGTYDEWVQSLSQATELKNNFNDLQSQLNSLSQQLKNTTSEDEKVKIINQILSLTDQISSYEQKLIDFDKNQKNSAVNTTAMINDVKSSLEDNISVLKQELDGTVNNDELQKILKDTISETNARIGGFNSYLDNMKSDITKQIEAESLKLVENMDKKDEALKKSITDIDSNVNTSISFLSAQLKSKTAELETAIANGNTSLAESLSSEINSRTEEINALYQQKIAELETAKQNLQSAYNLKVTELDEFKQNNTVSISENDTWVIGGVDTGKSIRGRDG